MNVVPQWLKSNPFPALGAAKLFVSKNAFCLLLDEKGDFHVINLESGATSLTFSQWLLPDCRDLDEPVGFRCSRDGRRVAVAVKSRDGYDYALIDCTSPDHCSWVSGVSGYQSNSAVFDVSPDGKSFVYYRDENILALRSWPSGEEAELKTICSSCVAFSPDGLFLADGYSAVDLWKLDPNPCYVGRLSGHYSVYDLEFNADSTALLILGSNQGYDTGLIAISIPDGKDLNFPRFYHHERDASDFGVATFCQGASLAFGVVDMFDEPILRTQDGSRQISMIVEYDQKGIASVCEGETVAVATSYQLDLYHSKTAKLIVSHSLYSTSVEAASSCD